MYVRNATSIALSFFFGMGAASLLKRAPVAALFLAGYLVIVVVWPFAPARFTWGVWPLVGLIYALAAVAVWEWGAPPKQHIASGDEARVTIPLPPRAFHSARAILRPLALATLLALAVGYAGYNYLGVTRHWWTVVQQSVADRARPLAEWVRANTDSAAVLATDDDVLMYLYTGRQAIPNGAFTPQEHLVAQTPEFAVSALRTILDQYHPDFVLASTQYGTYRGARLWCRNRRRNCAWLARSRRGRYSFRSERAAVPSRRRVHEAAPTGSPKASNGAGAAPDARAAGVAGPDGRTNR